jgi:predicted SAM-dependent methyltransferase
MRAISAYITRKTNREGLLYQVLVHLFLLAKQAANLHNQLVRDRRIKKHYMSHSEVKIHFGCGSDDLEGFLNTDILGKIPVDIAKRTPFPSASVDLAYSDNLVEHVLNREFEFHLKEVHRILKKDGIYIIATPSLSKIVGILYDKNASQERRWLLERYEKQHGTQIDPATYLNRLMHVDYGHKFLYDFESIHRLAERIGYSSIETIPNLEVPDKTIRDNLRRKKGKSWSLQTETFLLSKSA